MYGRIFKTPHILSYIDTGESTGATSRASATSRRDERMVP